MPNKYNHVSFDIETIDTCPSAIVLSIGAAKFNLEDDETFDDIKYDESRAFYASLEMQTQIDEGRTFSEDTFKWWLQQSKDAQKVFHENKYQTTDVLRDLSEFCAGTKYAWGNGNMFDNVIIRSLYESYGHTYPYHYTRDLDLRTYKIAAGNPKISVQAEGMVKHNALADAVFQAILIQKFHAEINR